MPETVATQAPPWQIPLQQAFNYYLEGGGFRFRGANEDPYAREWGMPVALNDARAVVLRARNHGRRRVVLGEPIGTTVSS